jgi:23S rRNA (adenine2030-N6)-methyltransferase
MLSYRHAYHAGNFADVLKHHIQIHILDYLAQKDKPYCCIDTHAGAGDYSLTAEYALKNREFDNGIGLLWARKDMPQSLNRYVKLIKAFNHTPQLTRYCGSAMISAQLMRENDRLFLYELHTTEVKILNTVFAKSRGIKIFNADGLKQSFGLLPPLEKRGLIMIDPSYEIKTDYADVVKAIIEMHKRFASGIYALWYPVINRQRNNSLERALINSGIKNIQLFELSIAPDNEQLGMNATGMIIINPPWTLLADMKKVLPYLATTLGGESGSYRIETLVSEK